MEWVVKATSQSPGNILQELGGTQGLCGRV